MKIIPYLRFVWATFMIINFVKRTNFSFGTADHMEIFFVILGGLTTLIFSSYCVIIGLQEIGTRQIIDAIFFEYFGLFFELLVFLGGLYLLFLLRRQQVDLWRIGLTTLMQFGLITLIIVDFRRIRAS